MSPIRITSVPIGLLMLLALLFVGCGDKNSQSSFITDSSSKGAHVAGWLPDAHMVAATANINSCAECHGSDFAGGISKVACTQCHMGDQQNIHPLSWGELTYARHPDYVNQNGIASCTNIYCHGKSLTGVASSGPSCSSCHIGGPMKVHPTALSEWMSTTSQNFHGVYVKNNGIASCANVVCHGTNLLGVTGSGFSCQSCHSLNW